MINFNRLVSVIIPCYNSENTINDCLLSIINQTHIDLQIVIIDDGSTDSTKKIIKSHNDHRIILLENSLNLGIVAALNKGLENAQGKYILRIDSDDIAHPSLADTLFLFLEKNPDHFVCGSNMIQFPIYNEICYPELDKYLKVHTLFRSPFSHSSVMFRNNKYIYYDKKFEFVEDIELWTRFIKLGKFHNIQNYLCNYRVSLNQITSREDYEMRRTNLLYLLFLRNGFDFFNLNNEFQVYFASLLTNKKLNVKPICFIDLLKKIKKSNRMNGYFEDSILVKSFEVCISNYLFNNYRLKECLQVIFYNLSIFLKILSLTYDSYFINTRRRT